MFLTGMTVLFQYKTETECSMNSYINSIMDAVLKDENHRITEEEALKLVSVSHEDLHFLFAAASKIKHHYGKNTISTCAIINAKSGKCPENCAFCSQSAHHDTGIASYPLKSADEIAADAVKMKKGLSRYSMVTSGARLSDKELGVIMEACGRIIKETGLSVCGSLGMLNMETALKLRKSGMTRYHHNLETSRSFFPNICTTHDYDEDIETLKTAKAAGMEVCSGGIMGLGESWEQRFELANTLKEADVDSIPINFLNPIKGTRLEQRPLLTPCEALKCIALFRFILPSKEIRICGGREVTLGDFQSWVFAAGADGIMIGNYLTTTGRNVDDDLKMIRAMCQPDERV